MQLWVTTLVVSSLFAQLAAADEHPIKKIIKLLDELKGKAIEEGKAEEKKFNKFMWWCQDSEKALNLAITKGEENRDRLQEKRNSLQMKKQSLETDLQHLNDQMADLDAEMKEKKDELDEETKNYEINKGNLEDSLKAISDAMATIDDTQDKKDKKFIQMRASSPTHKLAKMPVVLQQLSEDDLSVLSAPNHGGKLMEVLNNLNQTITEKYDVLNIDQTNRMNTYDTYKKGADSTQDRTNDAKSATSDELAETEGKLGTAKEELSSQMDDNRADKATLAATINDCKMKQAEWADRKAKRKVEQVSLEKATEIMERVTHVQTEKNQHEANPEKPTLLLQLDDPKAKAINLLKQAARKAHSRSFEKFADQLSMSLTGPFDDINNQIQKMIFRLQTEQKDEDEHKRWCDQEIQMSEDSQKNKEDKIVELDTKIESMTNRVTGELEPAIKDHKDSLVELKAHAKDITELRNENKKENAIALKDAQDAQNALVAAIKEIQSAYGVQNQLSLVQEPVELPENPDTWDSSYSGVSKDGGNPGDGIMALLESVLADFSNMEAEVQAQEEQENNQYLDDFQAANEDIAEKTATLTANVEEKGQLKKDTTASQKFLKSTKKELKSVKKYIDELQPACVEGDSSYEDRKKARKDEIDALKEALDTLKKAFQDK